MLSLVLCKSLEFNNHISVTILSSILRKEAHGQKYSAMSWKSWLMEVFYTMVGMTLSCSCTALLTGGSTSGFEPDVP